MRPAISAISDDSLFVQDDWHVNQSLTLNLGLRWEYFAPLNGKAGYNLKTFFFPPPAPTSS